MIWGLLIHLFLFGAVAALVKHQSISRFRGIVGDASTSTWLAAPICIPKSDSSNTLVKFTMREAKNCDTNIVSGFLDQLRTFHSALLPEIESTQLVVATSPLIKEGDTIQSLMPQIRNCHVVFAQPMTVMGSTNIDNKIEPIGFASYHFKYTQLGAPPLMHMEHLFVNPNCRSQGAGLALMNELANIGKQHRCSHMEWSVHRENTRGVHFYNSIGARHIEQLQMVNINSHMSGNGKDIVSNTMKWIPAEWDV
jgi:ribosomal protein S18 acetylase RimI-like enzyme